MSDEPKKPPPADKPAAKPAEKSETIDIAAESSPEEILEQQQREARARAEACNAELQTVLRKHRCYIAPMLTSEPVGNGPSQRVLLGATYAVFPMSG